MAARKEENAGLRFGEVCGLFCRRLDDGAKNQLDRMNIWLPDTAVRVEDCGSSEEKVSPHVDDIGSAIVAYRYRGHLYSSGDYRTTQILGRLTGTARGNREKERRTAVLIQKRISRDLVADDDLISSLHDNVKGMLASLGAEKQKLLRMDIIRFVRKAASHWDGMDLEERDGEAFPMDDEVFDAVIFDAAYQLNLDTEEGTACAMLWLLLGSLLRNEAGRICRHYDSAFVPSGRRGDQQISLLDRIDALLSPGSFGSVYSGNDLDRRFPGIDWVCDLCADHLNAQEGFDDHLPFWQCRRCGWLNPIHERFIYSNREDAERDIPMDARDMAEAVERRRRELEK